MSDLISDKTWMIILQALIAIVFLSCIYKTFRSKNSVASVALQRGDISWNWFVFCWGILVLVVQQITRVSTYGVGYKVFISLCDFFILGYLCFYNDHFRNILVKVMHVTKNKDEKH